MWTLPIDSERVKILTQYLQRVFCMHLKCFNVFKYYSAVNYEKISYFTETNQRKG